MFSGIVEGTAEVQSLNPQPGGVKLVIALGAMGEGLSSGQSVAVNGVCLTAVAPVGSGWSFDVITETLRKTNLGQLKVGSYVNIERSMRLGDGLEGHFVQGHVQAVGVLSKRLATDKDFQLTFTPPAAIMPYCAPLGCIAINGVSLTIAAVTPETFSVALIPTTLERTNLGQLKEGDTVNIETDILARQIVHYLQNAKGL
jgi:riboflavin synthase